MWQPIDSAPADGRALLLRGFHDDGSRWYAECRWDWLSRSWVGVRDSNHRWPNPTDYQPLEA